MSVYGHLRYIGVLTPDGSSDVFASVCLAQRHDVDRTLTLPIVGSSLLPGVAMVPFSSEFDG